MGHVEVVELLLADGADLHAVDEVCVVPFFNDQHMMFLLSSSVCFIGLYFPPKLSLICFAFYFCSLLLRTG